MYRIHFHGRGGQGIKTAGRVLGSAFFLEGFEVQDAPRYGAERRGAPMFAYVRANRSCIVERGVIHNPDLVVVADVLEWQGDAYPDPASASTGGGLPQETGTLRPVVNPAARRNDLARYSEPHRCVLARA